MQTDLDELRESRRPGLTCVITRYLASIFDALAAGGGGPEAIRKLAAAEHSKHCVLLRGVIQAAEATGTDQARFARNGRDALDAVEHHDPHIAARTIGYPSVGAWGLRTVRALRGEPGRRGPIPHAGRGGSRSGDSVGARRRSPGTSGRRDRLPAFPRRGRSGSGHRHGSQLRRTAEIRWAHGRLDIPSDPQRDAPGWHGVRRVRIGNFHVGIDDLDPFRMPAVAGLAPRLSARDADDWSDDDQARLAPARRGSPRRSAEVAAAISVLVPLSRSRPRSAQLQFS